MKKDQTKHGPYLHMKINKRKTEIIIALLHCCSFICYLMVLLVKYILFLSYLSGNFPTSYWLQSQK